MVWVGLDDLAVKSFCLVDIAGMVMAHCLTKSFRHGVHDRRLQEATLVEFLLSAAFFHGFVQKLLQLSNSRVILE
jgi:hypothetical protein